jgi:sulfite exporter TauE/SafE
MFDWLLIFVGGLLGSSHCIGMCGGFAVIVGANPFGFWRNLLRQLVYNVGRVLTYILGGAIAGYLGWRMTISITTLSHVQAILCILAGLLLLWQGMVSVGWLRPPNFFSSNSGCSAAAMFAGLLRQHSWLQVFVAGMANGFLPCGLVYAYLALAISSTSMIGGAGVMALFGAGTIPVMVSIGCGATVLSLNWRRYIFRLAAWCVVLMGIISIARGVGFLPLFGQTGCPLCH